jgi:ABC-type Fe3+/spermidine/putrescine transport system ATPase subunit
MTILEISHVSKSFANTQALHNVSFGVDEGEIVCLLGPSGCGKTTLLRIIAGLETPDAGQVVFCGQDLGPVPPHRRDFGLMFQDYALFPHKNVFDNVAFGLRMRRDKLEARDQEQKIEIRVRDVLALVGLQGFERRSVNQLSGGEAQRVALARSLAPRPSLLMLDEPLGSLDRALRERLMNELRDILKSVGVTTLYVTHDQAEAFATADRAVLMNAGHVEQVGSPERIYCCPVTPFVAHFLGLTNIAEGQVIGQDRVASPWGEMAALTDNRRPGDRVSILVRPEAASLVTDGSLSNQHAAVEEGSLIRGRLVARSFRGGRYRLDIQPEVGPRLTFELMIVGTLPVDLENRVTVALDPAGVVLLPA